MIYDLSNIVKLRWYSWKVNYDFIMIFSKGGYKKPVVSLYHILITITQIASNNK